MHRLFAALFLILACASAGPASAASFDCARARTPDERAICKSRELSELDVRMAVWYEAVTGLVPMGTRGAIQDEQHEWLERRGRCGSDFGCLRRAYNRRIGELHDHYEDIKSRGPF